MNPSEIDIDPRNIRYSRLNRPLFGDPIKQMLGEILLKSARGRGEWVPVDFNAEFGKGLIPYFMSALDSMRKKGYVEYSTEKDDFTVEPTRKLARYYRLVDYLNKNP